MRRSQRRDGGGGRFHILAQPGAEHFEIGFGRAVHQLFFIVAQFDFLDVELLGDDAGGSGQHAPDGRIGDDDDGARQRLANLQIALRPQVAAKRDGGHRTAHLLLQFDIPPLEGSGRKIAQVHRFRHRLGPQIPVHRFGGERNKRRRHFGEGDQHMMQSRVGFLLVRVVLALPETAAAAADIPVGQVVDKLAETVGGFLQIVVIQFVPDLLDHLRKRT